MAQDTSTPTSQAHLPKLFDHNIINDIISNKMTISDTEGSKRVLNVDVLIAGSGPVGYVSQNKGSSM